MHSNMNNKKLILLILIIDAILIGITGILVSNKEYSSMMMQSVFAFLAGIVQIILCISGLIVNRRFYNKGAILFYILHIIITLVFVNISDSGYFYHKYGH